MKNSDITRRLATFSCSFLLFLLLGKKHCNFNLVIYFSSIMQKTTKKSILTAQVRFLLPRTAYHSHIHHRQPGVPVAFVSSYVKECAVKNTREQESINKIWEFKGY